MGRISRKLYRFLFMFSIGFTLLNVLLLFPLLSTFFVFMHGLLFIFLLFIQFIWTTSNIDEVLSINPSNVSVFGDFNAHHKDWPTYSGGTNSPSELCYNFYISNDLPLMVNFPTWITDCDSHNPALLDLFLSSDASICSTMAFPLFGKSDHVAVSVSIDFPTKSKYPILNLLSLLPSIAKHMTILKLTEMVFVIIWEMLYGRRSLNSMLLLLLLIEFRFEIV